MSFTFKQKFHAVGQGLFYSSSLSKDTNTANIVFDCGSDKIDFVNREVVEYKKEVKEIDLLILSHLHYDHVSGLDELLKDTTVKTVVLPYLNKFERMLLQIDNGSKSQWYNSFVDNPYTWLSEKEKITNIVVINGNGENTNEDNTNDLSLSDNFEIQNQLNNINSNVKSQIETEEKVKYNQNISFYQASGYIKIANLYFKFFNYKIDETKLGNFKNALKKLNIIDTKTALDILKDTTKRKDLEQAYKQIEKHDLNKTSLATYQGLIFSKKEDRVYFDITSSCMNHHMLFNMCCCDDCERDGFIDWHCHGHISKNRHGYDYHCHCNSHNNCKNMIGTLLLGDIKLDYKTNRKDEFFNYYANLLKTVQLVQLSHHGANNGWNDELINQIPKYCLYIASHAVKNKYAHPHKEVLVKLAREQRRYISVTEYDEYFLEFKFS